ncbi:MAG: UDP-glucose 4-epimerase GalE [Bacteroidota bacterium]
MKKILVTGGAGYIGSHTVVELHNNGYEPIIIDNFSNSEKSVIEGIRAITGVKPKLYEGDCTDSNFMQDVFRIENPDGAIHFAALKAVGESVEQPLRYYQNNIDSLLVLLNTMEKFGSKHLVFSSSCTVYGTPDVLPVTEASPIKNAESPYGYTKQVSERIIEDAVGVIEGLSAVALRYFNPIGAHPSANIGELPLGIPNNLIPFVTQTAAGIREELVVFGNDYNTPDGTNIRDYIHVVDLAKAHVKTLEYLEKNDPMYDVINVGTGQGNSVLEVIETFQKVNNIDLPYRIGPRRHGDVEQVYAGVDKATEALQWRSELTLEDALRDAWKWQQSL